jgi:hypothetical protein
MKKSVRNCLGLASMMALPLMFTSCGEFDNPLENLPSSTVPTPYSVDITTATGDITIESDGAVISGTPADDIIINIKAGVHEVTFNDIPLVGGDYLRINCNGDVTLNLKNENYICDINTNGHTVTINASDATNKLFVSGAGSFTPITGHGTIKIEGGKLVATSPNTINAIECDVIVTGGVLRAHCQGSGFSIDGDLTVSGSGAVYIGGNSDVTGKAVSGTVTGAYDYNPDTHSWSTEKLNGTSTDKHSVSTDNTTASPTGSNWAVI